MEIIVEEAKGRIDKYLAEELDISRSKVNKLILAGNILVNDEEVKNGYSVKAGDIITVDSDYQEDIDIVPEDIPINIIYEDDDLMVINKESGMVVHPGSGNYQHTLVNALMFYTNKLSSVNGDMRPGIIHRIDKDTSGILLVAKNDKAHEKLADMLSRHEIDRQYIALLKGNFPSDTATIYAPIGRDINNRKKMAVTSINSKNAITHLTVLKRYKKYTLVNLKLETGRTHQIRVHMQYIGYPIFNDPVYTNDQTTEFGQFLHSASVDFKHPTTGEHMHFECPLPKEFQDKLDELDEEMK